MARKKNKLDMTVTEQITSIAETFCKDYCKWPVLYDEEEEGVELCNSVHCQNCPINQL